MIYRGINNGTSLPRYGPSGPHTAGVYLVGMNEADFERQRYRLGPESLKRYPHLERIGTGPYNDQFHAIRLLYRLQLCNCVTVLSLRLSYHHMTGRLARVDRVVVIRTRPRSTTAREVNLKRWHRYSASQPTTAKGKCSRFHALVES